MYSPKKGRDESARYELTLAERLREEEPDFDRTCVDHTPFRLRAKIDCITIKSKMFKEAINEDVLQGLTATVYGDNRSNERTLHDPTPEDLRYVISVDPLAPVYYIEIAVDAYLPTGSNNIYLLRGLKEQVFHCWAPQVQERFVNGKRKYWDTGVKRWLYCGTSHDAPLTSFRFECKQNGITVAAYLKTLDQGRPTSQTVFRVEFKLSGAEPGHMGVEVIADLPNFLRKLRKMCMGAFTFGCGFEDTKQRTGKSIAPPELIWNKYGAAWVLTRSKRLTLRRDAKVNRAYGDALNELQRAFKRFEWDGLLGKPSCAESRASAPGLMPRSAWRRRNRLTTESRSLACLGGSEAAR